MKCPTIVWVAALSVACAGSADEQRTAGGASASQPAAAKWSGDVPVGLYFMTRFWPSSGSLEKSVWYFAPDGTVYQNLTDGFSEADLAAHSGPRGKAERAGDELKVTWADGSVTTASFSQSETGFGFDAGIFTPVKPITDPQALAGHYEGGESLSGGGGGAASSTTYDLRADGTFASGSVASVSSRSSQSTVSAGATGAASGTWAATRYSITFTDAAGKTVRYMAFPYDDASTPVNPDRLYIGGTLYKRR